MSDDEAIVAKARQLIRASYGEDVAAYHETHDTAIWGFMLYGARNSMEHDHRLARAIGQTFEHLRAIVDRVEISGDGADDLRAFLLRLTSPESIEAAARHRMELKVAAAMWPTGRVLTDNEWAVMREHAVTSFQETLICLLAGR